MKEGSVYEMLQIWASPVVASVIYSSIVCTGTETLIAALRRSFHI